MGSDRIVEGLVNPTNQDFFVGIGFAIPINVAAEPPDCRGLIGRLHQDGRWVTANDYPKI